MESKPPAEARHSCTTSPRTDESLVAILQSRVGSPGEVTLRRRKMRPSFRHLWVGEGYVITGKETKLGGYSRDATRSAV